jgi:hypothetical protein
VKSNNNQEKLSPVDAYKIALETRNLEIGLFWQRSNYFLVLNVALALGFFKTDVFYYSIALSVFGVSSSILWLRVNLGSKFWQSRWEERLRVQEGKISDDLNFFSASDTFIKKDVENNITRGHTRNNWFKNWVDNQTKKRHSVSLNMTILSISFVVGWAILGFVKAYS